MIIGEKIRELREALGLSQADLAAAAGCRQPTITSIENGFQRTSRYLPQIAHALKVEVADLDPNFPMPLTGLTAATAFEVMLEQITDYDAGDRQALARVFLTLAREPRNEKIAASLADQMRLRLELLIRPYLKK